MCKPHVESPRAGKSIRTSPTVRERPQASLATIPRPRKSTHNENPDRQRHRSAPPHAPMPTDQGVPLTRPGESLEWRMREAGPQEYIDCYVPAVTCSPTPFL